MANVRASIEAFETMVGQTVEAVAVGRRVARLEEEAAWPEPVEPIGRGEALALLDDEYDGGMGSLDPPHPIYAWTRSWVLFLNGEEGAAQLSWVPRHPRRCVPEVGGDWWVGEPYDWRELSGDGDPRGTGAVADGPDPIGGAPSPLSSVPRTLLDAIRSRTT